MIQESKIIVENSKNMLEKINKRYIIIDIFLVKVQYSDRINKSKIKTEYSRD